MLTLLSSQRKGRSCRSVCSLWIDLCSCVSVRVCSGVVLSIFGKVGTDAVVVGSSFQGPFVGWTVEFTTYNVATF